MFIRVASKSTPAGWHCERRSVMEHKIKVAIKEPGKELEIKEISDDLETLQKIVGGMIESFYPMENLEENGIVIFGNDEGKLNNPQSNFWLYNKQDCFCGTAIFFKDDEEGGMDSLQENDILEIRKFLENNKMSERERLYMNNYIKGHF